MVEAKNSSIPNTEINQTNNQVENSEQNVHTEAIKLVGTSVIVLYHSPGVGGSTLARMLAEKIEGAVFYDGGEEIRKSQGLSKSHTNYIPRSIGVDQNIDEIQMELMRNATPEHPVIIDAKLGGFNALRLMHQNPSLNIIPILITCDQRTAAERMKKRTSEELEKKFESYSTQVLSGELSNYEFEILLKKLHKEAEKNTVENKIAETKRRIQRDRTQFGKAHPILRGVDLYNPGARVIVGYDMDPKTNKPRPRLEKLHKARLSTSRLNKEQAFEALVDKLVGLGSVKRIHDWKKTQKDLLLSERLEAERIRLGLPKPKTIKDVEDIARRLDRKQEIIINEDIKTESMTEKNEIFNVDKNGKNRPSEIFENKPKSTTRSGKSIGEPVSKRPNFPEKHPNPYHPSKAKERNN